MDKHAHSPPRHPSNRALIPLSSFIQFTHLPFPSASSNSCKPLFLFHQPPHSHRAHPTSAWIAWFPVLFYSTIYIGDLYKRSTPAVSTPDAQAALDAEAIRLGSRALFYSSLLSLLANFALPPFVTEARKCITSPTGREAEEGWWERMCRVPRSLQVHLASLWAVSHLVFAGCMLGTLYVDSSFSATSLIGKLIRPVEVSPTA